MGRSEEEIEGEQLYERKDNLKPEMNLENKIFSVKDLMKQKCGFNSQNLTCTKRKEMYSIHDGREIKN